VDVRAGAALGIAAGVAAAAWVGRRGPGAADGFVPYYERDRGEVEGA